MRHLSKYRLLLKQYLKLAAQLLVLGSILLLFVSPSAASDPLLTSIFKKLSEESLYSYPMYSGGKTEVLQYVRSQDAYAELYGETEFKALSASQSDSYAGVGFYLEKGKSGQLICLLMHGGLDQNSGVQSGDVLWAVNDEFVGGRSVPYVASKLRGVSNSYVKLTLLRGVGKLYSVNLARKLYSAPSVYLDSSSGIPRIVLQQFTKDTRKKLATILHALGRQPIIIDLRNNSGGLVWEAARCAELFFPPRSRLFSVVSRDGSKTAIASAGWKASTARIFLWQNAYTASASEAFISAMKQRNDVVLVGSSSFGKSEIQKISKLTNNTYLKFTFARVVHHYGTITNTGSLVADVLLPHRAPDQMYYLKTISLLN